MDRGRRRRGRSRRRRGKRRRGRRRGFGLDDEIESARSSDSKDISSKSSEEKPKTAKGGQGRGDLGPVKAEPEKREIGNYSFSILFLSSQGILVYVSSFVIFFHLFFHF